jgi:hypothetical protein
VWHVQQPGDAPHQVLLVRVLAAVGEGDQPQQLDDALLLGGVEPGVDERRELVERARASRLLLRQPHELARLLGGEIEGALERGAHHGALLVPDARVGAHDLEHQRGGGEAQRVLALGLRRLGRPCDLRLEQLPQRLEHASQATTRPGARDLRPAVEPRLRASAVSSSTWAQSSPAVLACASRIRPVGPHRSD